jgi:hypothetical protein
MSSPSEDDARSPFSLSEEAEITLDRIAEEAKRREVDPQVGDSLRKLALKTWTAREGVECFIVQNELEGYVRMCALLGQEPSLPQYWWCGYVRMNRAMFAVPGYKGLLTYVPVSGGITLKAEDSEGCIIYGYDTNHAWDHAKAGFWTPETMTEETNRFATGLICAAKYETAYLEARTEKGKAQIIDLFHAELRESGIEFKLTENFGAMLNVLFGKL